MSVKLEDKGNSLVELSTSVSGKEFEEAKEKAFRKLASKIQIKGFRKGQAPLEMVKNRISQYEIINEAINLSLNDAYNAALRESKIRPFNSPEVDVTRVDDKGYDVTFKFTKYPEVKLGKYKGLKTKLETAKVTAKDVDESIEKLLKENASLELKDGPAAMGDTVVFDFKGYIDGKEFEGGSADNYSLVLGSQQFIPGFEEQLVGVTAESKKDVLVTFPEQYVKNLAGKDAKFVCMVHEVKANVTPKLDEEFVEMLAIDGVKTVEDLKKHQKEALKTEKENEAVKKQFDELVKTIIDNAEVEIGDAVLKNEADGLKENLINQIKQNGLTYEQYKEITASTDESIEAQFMAQAKENLKGYLVISEIGRAENLVITKADVDNYYNQIAKTYNMKVEDVRKAYGNDDSKVANQLMNSKIYEFIRLNNNVDEEAEAKKEEPKAEEKPAKKPAAKKAAAPKAEEKKPAAKKATKTKKAE